MDNCSKNRAGALGDLPVDPLVEILSRVPAKSVCRFKCVSKAWRDLIADPHHRKKLPQAMQGLFCSRRDRSSKAYRCSLIDLTAGSVPMDIDPSFTFLTELPGIQFLTLRDSCNGLILFGHSRERRSVTFSMGYIVCNPTTKQWGAVPACASLAPLLSTYAYLAFDPAVSSHFHVVQFQVEEDEQFSSVHAYSSETGTWTHNQIDKQEEQGQLVGWHHQVDFDFGDLHRRCPFVNGFLHLIVWDADQLKILVLDLQGKTRRMIPVPHLDSVDKCYFGQSQGRMHYMAEEPLHAYATRYKMSIWVLQDYDTQEWVLKDTVNFDKVFGENSSTGNNVVFDMIDIHQDCDVVFFAHPSGNKLIAYDMGSKEVSVLATFNNESCLWMDTVRYVPYFSESPVLTNKH